MRPFSLSLAALLFVAPVSAADRGERIGQAGAVAPMATATLDTERELARDADILFGEAIATNAKGAAGLIFVDDTRLYVAENSDIKIDRYVFGGKPRLDIRLARGALRLASGRIKGENIRIGTTVAHIGLRGTVVSVSATSDRTVLYVEDGEAFAEVGGDQVAVREGQSLVIERDDPGVVGEGWPSDLSAAVAAMSTSLAVAATPAVATPAEVTDLDKDKANAAAAGVGSSDSGFGYN